MLVNQLISNNRRITIIHLSIRIDSKYRQGNNNLKVTTLIDSLYLSKKRVVMTNRTLKRIKLLFRRITNRVISIQVDLYKEQLREQTNICNVVIQMIMEQRLCSISILIWSPKYNIYTIINKPMHLKNNSAIKLKGIKGNRTPKCLPVIHSAKTNSSTHLYLSVQWTQAAAR